MKLYQKILLGFLTIAFMTILASYFGLNAINNITSEFRKVEFQTIPVIRTLDNLNKFGLIIVSATNKLLLLKKEKKTNEINLEINHKINQLIDATKLYNDYLLEYKNLLNTYFPEETDFFDKIKTSGMKLQNTSNEIIALDHQRINKKSLLRIKEKFEEYEVSFLENINNALIHENKEFEERKFSVNTTLTNSTNLIILVSILIFIISILVGLFISRSISTPILKLKDLTVEISQGNLNTKIDIETNDEIGILSASFNRMTKDLKNSIEKQKRLTELSNKLAKNEKMKSDELFTLNKELTATTEELKLSKINLENIVIKRTKELSEEKKSLEIKIQNRTKEISDINKKLSEKIRDLEIFHKAAVGRELEMIKLKKRIKELESKLNTQ